MPLSIDLHVKCPFHKKWNKKKTPIFFSWNFHTVFREQIAIFYQIFKSGSSKNFFLNVRNLQRWEIPAYLVCWNLPVLSSHQNCIICSVDDHQSWIRESMNHFSWIIVSSYIILSFSLLPSRGSPLKLTWLMAEALCEWRGRNREIK